MTASLTEGVTRVLPGILTGAGRGWLGACGGEGCSGLAGGDARSMVNSCRFLVRDDTDCTYCL